MLTQQPVFVHNGIFVLSVSLHRLEAYIYAHDLLVAHALCIFHRNSGRSGNPQDLLVVVASPFSLLGCGPVVYARRPQVH